MSLDKDTTQNFFNKLWDSSIVPALKKYIEIPSQSPAYDSDCLTNGLQEKVVDLLVNWVKEQKVEGLKVEVVQLKGRTPLIFLELDKVEGAKDDTIMMYGHFDKQPPMDGWRKGKGPYTPTEGELDNGHKVLYGRGGADDGYSIFAIVATMKALQLQKVKHSRIIAVVEGCEESGSFDLPHYIDHLKDRIGSPRLVVCLDSGTGDYETFWITTSLRGILCLNMHVSMIEEGVHSGSGSGIYADTFRVAKSLISRIEDENTGEVVKEFQVDIPKSVHDAAAETAKTLGETIYSQHKPLQGVTAMSTKLEDLLVNNTWKPMLSVTGCSGMPPVNTAGNVLRPKTSLRLSLRLPPTKDPKEAEKQLRDILTKDTPYGAKVEIDDCHAGSGMTALPLSNKLLSSMDEASKKFFGKQYLAQGEGGSIPFMKMLKQKLPEADICITGLLGPGSNAHSIDEFINITYAKKLNAVVCQIVADLSQ